MKEAVNNKQIELFGELIDSIIRDNNIAMLIDIPAGTMTPALKDNSNLGPVIQFYILLHALETCFKDMCEVADVDPEQKDNLIDGLLELVKKDVLRDEEEDDE